MKLCTINVLLYNCTTLWRQLNFVFITSKWLATIKLRVHRWRKAFHQKYRGQASPQVFVPEISCWYRDGIDREWKRGFVRGWKNFLTCSAHMLYRMETLHTYFLLFKHRQLCQLMIKMFSNHISSEFTFLMSKHFKEYRTCNLKILYLQLYTQLTILQLWMVPSESLQHPSEPWNCATY